MHSQEAGLFINVNIMHANIKLLDSLDCFHYILNPLLELVMGQLSTNFNIC